MTIIYGFTNKEKKCGIIAADNKSYGTTSRKADKIFLLEKRYAVAVHGQDTPITILGIIQSFESHTNYQRTNSISEIVDKIVNCTQKASSYLMPLYKESCEKGELNVDDWNACLKEESTLIILDCLDLRLCRIPLGHPFPPENLNNKPTISKLDDKHFYSFAIGELAEELRTEDINVESIENPIRFIENILKKDIAILAKKYPEHVEKIGDIGASVLVQNNEITYNSTFEEPEELIEEFYGKSLIGCKVEVLQIIKDT